jgi:hypothetical protein
VLLSAPAALIEFWLETIGRPRYGSEPGDIQKSGEDLDAKGLTEFLWDVLYWTWLCVFTAGVFGDVAWWLWVSSISCVVGVEVCANRCAGRCAVL